MSTAIFYITENGLNLAKRLQGLYPEARIEKFNADTVRQLWDKHENLIFIMASGIVVRTIPKNYFDSVGIDSVYRFSITPSKPTGVEPASYASVGETENYGFNPGDVARGVYSVNPGFKVDFDLSFDFFNDIYANAKLLSDSCKGFEDQNIVGKLSLSDCVAKSGTFGLRQDCSSSDESVLFTFAEGLSNCLDSVDDGCSCGFVLGEDVELSYDGNDTLLKYNGLEYLLPFKVELGEGFVKALPSKIKGALFAEKSPSGFTISKSSGLKACRINDRTFKLCADSKEKYPILIDGKKSFANVPVRFAYSIEDKAAPASVDFKLELLEKGTAVVSWVDSVSPDVAGFRIYYDANPFSVPVASFKDSLVNESKPFISVRDVLSNKEILFVDDGRYYYSFSAPSANFSFSVAPFDFDNNYNSKFRSVAVG